MKSRILFIIISAYVCYADNRALLVIDVQECFLPGGNLAVTDGEQVIPLINSIRNNYEDAFSIVVFTKDWHCPDHMSFASQYPSLNVMDVVNLQYNENGRLCFGKDVPSTNKFARACSETTYNLTQVLWPDHCVRNVSSGPLSSEIAMTITKKKSDILIYKGDDCEVDSYSAFLGNGGFKRTRLHGVLQQHRIDTVFIVGLALDYCVYYTALDAKTLGYKTYVVEDASRGVAPSTTVKALKKLKEDGVHVIKFRTLENYLEISSSTAPAASLYTLVFVISRLFTL